MPVRRQIVVALALVLCGIGILALPAGLEGPRVIRFGPGHGPSLLDLVGIALVTPGGLWLLYVIFSRLAAVRLPSGALFGLGAGFGLGLGLTVASVFADFSAWWILGLSLVTLIEIFLIAGTWRRA
ncbi:hypothetical protein HDA40_002248 [Hamadaea flava]|uniref:DUF4345 domain-containing protein n=1 Tax=Hamadaea flava TaxID=1742688 RepID=A0ABV8LJZ2_9ACTN|nr:hypothetical protein [Hamadaea flava]MCP2323741.1 hypothetical protein [Hamadaea flava]